MGTLRLREEAEVCISSPFSHLLTWPPLTQDDLKMIANTGMPCLKAPSDTEARCGAAGGCQALATTSG